MSRLNIIKKQLEDLSSPDPEKVRAAYEALANNARENTRALVAIIDAQQKQIDKSPFAVKYSDYEEFRSLLQQSKEDPEKAKQLQEELSKTKSVALLLEYLFEESDTAMSLLTSWGELSVRLFGHIKNKQWRLPKDIQEDVTEILKLTDMYAAIKLGEEQP
jgi:hypothetical protein